jgi:hypothetical protein
LKEGSEVVAENAGEERIERRTVRRAINLRRLLTAMGYQPFLKLYGLSLPHKNMEKQ